MNTPPRTVAVVLGWALGSLLAAPLVRAWDEKGHDIVVDAAVARLPADMPGFVRSEQARARLRFLGSEPDRWRNVKLAPMSQINNPDHFFDLEFLALYELTPQTLPRRRYDFIIHMATYKAKHPDKDYGYDPARDPERWKEWPGFAPYRICELYAQLKSSWRTFNTYSKYRDLTQPGELESCRDNIIYLMGMMSHYVADVAQPLHTTEHYDGWVGPNPQGYVTRRGYIHRLIDGRALRAAGLTADALPNDLPAPRIEEERLFEQVVAYILETHSHVEETYALEKKGALTPGSPTFDEGTNFIKQRLAHAAVMLAALWESAHRDAGTDEFRERLFQRKRPPAPNRNSKGAPPRTEPRP